MTQDEMLAKLHSLPFAYIDDLPGAGFTERPLWVNAKGYGYLSCDDPSDQYWEGDGLPPEAWKNVRQKLSEECLLYEDLVGTSLIDLLNEMYFGNFPEDEDPCEYLHELLALPEDCPKRIYCMNTIDGWQFFASEEEFKKAYERDWCDVAWEELSDNMLAECIGRLSDEETLYGKYTIVCIPDDFALSFENFIESLDTTYLGYFINSDELETYLKESCEQLKEYLIEEEADLFYDRLWDLYAIGEANGDISYCEAYSSLLLKTKENIHQKYQNAFVKLLVYDASKSIKATCAISIADILLELLDYETEGREFDAKVGKYIEASLIKYVDSCKWHLGYQLRDKSYVEIHTLIDFESVPDKSCPVMWYGPDDKTPIDKWLVSCQQSNGFGFDHDELLYHLIDDCDDCFEVWYLAECCYFLPDMEAILAECPIVFSVDDTNDRINQKFSEHFHLL